MSALLHHAVPDAAETVGWGMPFFTHSSRHITMPIVATVAPAGDGKRMNWKYESC